MAVIDMLNAPWAIQPEMYQQMHTIYGNYLNGEKQSVAELSAALGREVDNSHANYDVIDGVAVISIHGVMSKRANLFQAISGGASTQLLKRDLQTAIDDPTVHSILLDFDTPGGAVDGLPEFASAIYNARSQKPVVALASGLMASAGVWAGTAASEVYASDATAIIGSIGVISTHTDVSQLEKSRGTITTEIYAGKYKNIGTPHEPLSTEGRAVIQERVDYMYALFVDAVAKNRGVSVDTVLNNMADAKLFVGQQAVDAGLIDGIKTQSEIITMLVDRNLSASKTPVGSRRRISAQVPKNTTEAAMPEENENSLENTASKASNLQQEQAAEFTADFVAKNHPDIAAHFRNEGKATETQRVKDVFAQSMAGHDALIKDLAFDGKTTGPEAAVAVLGAERTLRAKTKTDFEADAPTPVDTGALETGSDDLKPGAKSSKDMAKEAQVLVDEASARGEKLSYSAAMKQVKDQ